MKILGKLAVLLILLFPILAASAPIFILDENGQLMGAEGVAVDNQFYDILFLDGTCTEVFGECDISNFAFQTFDEAQAASQALLDQVFVDSTDGLFDAIPASAFGCEAACIVWTPYGLLDNGELLFAIAVNDTNDNPDRTGGRSFQHNHPFADLSEDPTSVWAVWTPVTVPEPGTLALFGIGLAGMGFSRRRKKA